MARSLKNKLTAGIDEIPEYVVKQCIEQLKVPLANIYNASLESGIFPDKLKIAKVIPIHKKGDVREVFSKLLEKLLYNRLTTFIESNEVLNRGTTWLQDKKIYGNGITDFY